MAGLPLSSPPGYTKDRMDFFEDFEGSPVCAPSKDFLAHVVDVLELHSSLGDIDKGHTGHTGHMKDDISEDCAEGTEECAEVTHGWQTDDEDEHPQSAFFLQHQQPVMIVPVTTVVNQYQVMPRTNDEDYYSDASV